MTPIFGPVPSRRFGLSLGIDLSPGKKRCNFDCLYCELAPAKPVATIDDPPTVEEITGALEKALKEHPAIDVITLTANGEPTLYPRLDELIDRIDTVKKGAKTLILSNASTIADPRIQKALAKLDMVKLSLDCATPRCFKRLDRPLEGLTLESIVEGIRTFRQRFHKEMILEILMVRGLNTTENEIEAFNRILPTLGADRIDLGTVDRPPAYPVEALSYEELHTLAQRFDPSLPIHLTTRHPSKKARTAYTDAEILATLTKRPLTLDDIHTLFDDETLRRFENLLANGRITKKERGGLTFYGTLFSQQKEKKSPKTP